MLKFFGKKSLATLVILVMAISMLPVSASAATTITTFSEFGLSETPDAKADNESLTVSEDTGETLLKNAYSTKGFKNDVTTGTGTAALIRGFNTALSDGETVKARVSDAVVCYEDETKTNKVAKLIGHDIPAGNNYISGGLSISYVDSSGTFKGKMSSDYQVWSVDVQLSQIETGEVRLFSWCSTNHHYGTQLYGNDQKQSTISIRDGKVYVAPDTFTASDVCTDISEEIAAIEADAWYKFVRVIKIDRTDNFIYNKVYVFDANGNCIGGHDDWRVAGKVYGADNPRPISLGFAERNTPAGEYVLFDNFKSWNAYPPEVAFSAVIPESSTAGKVGAMKTLDSEVKYVTRGCNLFQYPYVNAEYKLDVYLPSVGGANEVVHLLASKDSYGINPNYRAFEITTVTPDDGTEPYSTVSTCSYDGTTVTATPMLLDADDGAVKLKAETWYTFKMETRVETGVFTATVTDTTTGEVLSTQEGTRHALTIYDTEAEKPSWSNKNTMTIIGAQGYDGAVLFDNFDAFGKSDSGSGHGSAKAACDFEAAAVGATVRSAIGTTSSWTPANYSTMAADDMCYVASLDDYMLTGKIATTTPVPLAIALDFSITELADDDIVLTKTLTGEEVEITETIGDDGNTITVELGELEYETTYILTVKNITDRLGFPIAEQNLALEVVKDPFTVTSIKFIDGSDGVTELSAALAKDDTVKASVYLSNEDVKAREYLIILALYNGNVLEDVTAMSGTIASGDAYNVVTNEALTAIDEGLTAQIYVWDSWSKMTPKTDGTDILPTPEA